jgi:hypothetical protein
MDKPRPSRFQPLSIAATIGGLALGRYAGVSLLIPGAISVVAFFGLRQFIPIAKRPMLLCLAWQAGQLGWFLVGTAIAPQLVGQIWLDALIMGGGMVWLYLSSGRPAAIFLGVYQAASLAINVLAFAAVPIDSPSARSLSVHIVWRVVALFLLGLFVWKRPDRTTVTAETFS